MTGLKLAKCLTQRLEARLPDVRVQAAFTGRMQRKAGAPAVRVGVRQAVHRGNILEAVIGVWLYTQTADVQALYEAVCAAAGELPCVIGGTEQEETRYDETVCGYVTACRLKTVVTAGEDPAGRLRFGDAVFDFFSDTPDVRLQGNVQTTSTYDGCTTAVYTGGGRRTVRGTGLLCGTDAQTRYAALEVKFGQEDTLFLPETVPFAAVLRELTVVYRSGTAVQFTFAFEETQEVCVL